MSNDPLSNVLSKALNYELIGRNEVILHPLSKLARGILKIFNANGFVGEVDLLTEARGSVGKLHLIGAMNKCGVIKPRFSVTMSDYEKYEKRYLPSVGVGILIVSTNQGLMTHEDAKKKKIGGRLIAYCY